MRSQVKVSLDVLELALYTLIFQFRDIPVSASEVLGFKVCAIITRLLLTVQNTKQSSPAIRST